VDYQQSLAYLYGLQRFGIKLGLENIRRLLERLGHPERAFAIVHVGGTNGKGSACACLAEILRLAGYSTGLYTSPHLHSFTERIRVNGLAVDETELAALTDEVRACCDDIPATFFEFTTALALLYFQRQGVECAVLEVGMGGRLDATNAVQPQVSVISTICLDHQQHLGATLSNIAAEKAGIIKPDTPLVIGRQPQAALEVLLQTAHQLNVPVWAAGRDFKVEAGEEGFVFHAPGLFLPDLKPKLPGRHQYDNCALALAAALRLREKGWHLSDTVLREGVAQVSWPGRLEWFAAVPGVLLDGAHNEGGAQVLARYLAELPSRKIHWVVGMKGDKNPAAIMQPLLPMVSNVYCTVPPVEDGVPTAALAALAGSAGCAAQIFETPREAVQAALAARRADDLILVAGSLFLVAAVREFLVELGQQSRPAPLCA